MGVSLHIDGREYQKKEVGIVEKEGQRERIVKSRGRKGAQQIFLYIIL